MPGTGSVAYALSNAHQTAGEMLGHLAEVWEGFTRRRLSQVLAAGLPAGGRCWEAAAGNGSVAVWLADQGMRVIATDVNPVHLPEHAGVTVLQHDDEHDDAPAEDLALVYARCAEAHWPSREKVVGKFARAVAPGGAVVIEDWGHWSGWVLWSPVPDAEGIYARYQKALMAVFAAAGNDSSWAGRTAGVMIDTGLVGVETQAFSRSWRGGSAGCLLPVVVAGQKREELLAHGATEADLDALPEVMGHPDTLVLGNLGFSTIGYRPEE